jgi:quercetin dioxygenase-like cupin family protein
MTFRAKVRNILLTPLVAAFVLSCAPAAPANTSPATAPTASPGIVRTDLGTTLPGTAPGQRLGLWHYTIPPGSALVPHRHPGWQIARIVSGTLTYTILAGTPTVIRANGEQQTPGAGQTIKLAAGDTVIENPGVEHFGANDGPDVVEIYTSTLLADGEPVAIPLATAAPSTSP